MNNYYEATNLANVDPAFAHENTAQLLMALVRAVLAVADELREQS